MAIIAVLGAGVTGLSSALRIQANGHAVTIVARDFPSGAETVDATTQIDYTSAWGGAHNRFILPPAGDIVGSSSPSSQMAREHAMSLTTWDEMRRLHDTHPEAGVTFLKGIEYYEEPSATETALTVGTARDVYGMREFRFHAPEELPAGVRLGFEYDTWCVNPMVYCAFLLRRFVYRGGKILKKQIRNPLEIFQMKDAGPFSVVINASGAGFGDPNVFITAGQTCLVANPCPVTISRQNANGRIGTFNVPRSFEGGTVIGGTKIPDNWDPHPSLALREELLRNFAATYPEILGDKGEFTVIRDIVGRRPTRRGGMRLEKEAVGSIVAGSKGEDNSGRCIIHAYGLGGRGFELSWGVAEKVAELLAEHIASAGLSSDEGRAKL